MANQLEGGAVSPYNRLDGKTPNEGAYVMRKMTVVFDDDELYTAVKVEAARRNRPLKEIVAEALREWLEVQEDLELGALAEEARREMQEKGSIPLEEFIRELEAERGQAQPI